MIKSTVSFSTNSVRTFGFVCKKINLYLNLTFKLTLNVSKA